MPAKSVDDPGFVAVPARRSVSVGIIDLFGALHKAEIDGGRSAVSVLVS
jgi:hypothetical protein